MEFCDADGYAELRTDASELDAGVGFDEIVNFCACGVVEYGCWVFGNVCFKVERREECASGSYGCESSVPPENERCE